MPISKSNCKKPRRWVTSRSLRKSAKKGHCQTFTKRPHVEPIQALTKGWVARMCHNEHIRSSNYLPEEIRLNVELFIQAMMEDGALLPRGLRKAVPTEYAFSHGEFKALVRHLMPGVDVPVNKLMELHKALEVYLHLQFVEGAVIAKQQGDSTLQPKHITLVRLKYFPPRD